MNYFRSSFLSNYSIHVFIYSIGLGELCPIMKSSLIIEQHEYFWCKQIFRFLYQEIGHIYVLCYCYILFFIQIFLYQDITIAQLMINQLL